MSNITKPRSQAKRIPLKLKSQILEEILLPDASIPEVAKKHNLSSTTLYGWRIDHVKRISQNLKNNQELSRDPKNNFIELVPEDLPKDDFPSKALSSPISKTNNYPNC